MKDWELIQKYVESGSQRAFADIGKRYANLVYATCLRELGDVQLAEDATQAVFILLAMKAPSFRKRQMLSSWLFQTAILTSKNIRRSEQRRRRREQEAQKGMPEEPALRLSGDLEPLLNDALGRLREVDREAILMRFTEDASYEEIGAALGIKEDAARMRVARSIEKLRCHFERRGVVLTVTAVAVALPPAFGPAPAHCAKLVQSAVARTAVISPSIHNIVQGVTRTMRYTRAIAVGTAAICVLTASAGTIAAIHPGRIAGQTGHRRLQPTVQRAVATVPPQSIASAASTTSAPATPVGIKVGDAMSDVLHVYGAPTSVNVDRASPSNGITYNYKSVNPASTAFAFGATGVLQQIIITEVDGTQQSVTRLAPVIPVGLPAFVRESGFAGVKLGDTMNLVVNKFGGADSVTVGPSAGAIAWNKVTDVRGATPNQGTPVPTVNVSTWDATLPSGLELAVTFSPDNKADVIYATGTDDNDATSSGVHLGSTEDDVIRLCHWPARQMRNGDLYTYSYASRGVLYQCRDGKVIAIIIAG